MILGKSTFLFLTCAPSPVLIFLKGLIARTRKFVAKFMIFFFFLFDFWSWGKKVTLGKSSYRIWNHSIGRANRRSLCWFPKKFICLSWKSFFLTCEFLTASYFVDYSEDWNFGRGNVFKRDSSCFVEYILSHLATIWNHLFLEMNL